jgi:hypothetical protein
MMTAVGTDLTTFQIKYWTTGSIFAANIKIEKQKQNFKYCDNLEKQIEPTSETS